MNEEWAMTIFVPRLLCSLLHCNLPVSRQPCSKIIYSSHLVFKWQGLSHITRETVYDDPSGVGDLHDLLFDLRDGGLLQNHRIVAIVEMRQFVPNWRRRVWTINAHIREKSIHHESSELKRYIYISCPHWLPLFGGMWWGDRAAGDRRNTVLKYEYVSKGQCV